jgi:hypothetical protein
VGCWFEFYSIEHLRAVALNTAGLLSYQPRLLNVSAIWGNYTVTGPHQAFDCVFYFCVKTYSGSVVQTKFTESVKNIFYDPSLKALDDSREDMGRNITIPQGQLPLRTDLTFGVGDAAGDLYTYMERQFVGAGNFWGEGRSRWDNDIVRGIFSQGSANFPSTMDNVATAMTNAMRTISGDTANGVAMKNIAFIHVRWLWLLLPLVMIILASIFLALTVWQSYRWGIPRWRSSAIAVMDHGISRSKERPGISVIASEAEKISELNHWADEMKVRLQRTGRYDTDIGLVDVPEDPRIGMHLSRYDGQ